MPEIDLMRVDHCVSDVKLDDSSSSPPGFFDGGGVPLDSDVKLDEEDSDSLKKRGRRGRPPRILAKASSPPISRKRREDEDVCFVCFDGGSLVLCDRRGCPKAYHPACVKRTEAFFRSRSKWNCGWHICTTCQKDSFYMCYTCPYSVCKRCVRSSEYVVVRENKGFCGICMKTIMLIENAAEANKEKVQVDFDDQGSWEYLFKIYWVSLKEKLGLSLDDLTKAKNPWKSSSSTAAKRRTTSRVHEKDDGNSPGVMKIRRAKVRKMDAVSVSNLGPSLDSNCSLGDRLPQLTSAATWATNELLDFVGYMKNGDISVLSKYDVQTLVLEYVRRNNLQNSPQNSEIMCDSKLMRLFGKERVDNLEMLKLLDSHFIDQVRSPVTDNSAGGVTETMSYQVNAGRSCDRLNTSEQHQEGESQQLNGHSIQVRPSSSDSRNHAVVKPDTSATLSNKPIDGLDTNMVWLYGDPDGKIHGPFSLYNLRQWNSSGHFPPELRIWRLGEQQHSSILLTDALNGQFHKTGLLQNHSIPKQEVTATIANDQNRSVAVPKIESRILDFSPNSVCTDQSVISSSNSVITRSSDVSNKSGNNCSHAVPLDFSLSNERDTVGFISLWDKRKVESSLLVQSPISCSLSLATLPRNSNCSLPPHERWSAGQTDGNSAATTACNQNGSLSGSAEKQVTATVQSCGQNWNAATPSSASNVWDSNSGLTSFPDNQEIDFLDLFSPTFKFNFASTTTDWQPIVAGPDECDESVSDLLAEVEAMESQKRLPSPTSTFRGPANPETHTQISFYVFAPFTFFSNLLAFTNQTDSKVPNFFFLSQTILCFSTLHFPVVRFESWVSQILNFSQKPTMEIESGSYQNAKKESWRTVLTLAYQSLGVVYGDLSISPLYVYKSTFAEDIHHSESNEEIFGVLSFIFWTITLVPLLKYVFIVLRADDNGEGGTFALYSLLCRHARVNSLPSCQLADEQLIEYKTDSIGSSSMPQSGFAASLKSTLEKHGVLQKILLVLALIGTCMVIGDGVLTPAISVFSAVSGVELSMSKEHHKYIELPAACVILIGLFALQHYGTHRVGFLFAPVILLWLMCISAIGVYNIFHWNPHVYQALSPYYMYKFLKKTQSRGWMSLGGILLCITGSEAMFADLGHFSQLSIKIAFTSLVYPSLILAYMGQAAYLSQHHIIESEYNIGFYVSVPERLRWPVLVIAILAAVVGSQAIITGTFSIIKQCSALGCFPKVKIVHTSSKIHGQIYIPEINWILMVLCLAVTIGFRDTKRLGNASGLAVITVMLVTTCLMSLVIVLCWHKSVIFAIVFVVFFGTIESLYFSASLIKFLEGAWVPIALAFCFLLAMCTWHYGTLKRYEYDVQNKVSVNWLLSLSQTLGIARVRGLGLIHTELVSGVPAIFSHFVTNLPAFHQVLVFLCVKSVPVPHVRPQERFLVGRIGPKEFRIYRCIVRFGYRDVHKDDFEFEGDLVCSIAEFIRTEAETAATAAETNGEDDDRMSVVGTCSTYMQGIEDHYESDIDDPDKPGTSEIRSPKPKKKSKSKVKKRVRFVVPETPKIEKETRQELMELTEAREGGVAYIMGNAYMKAKPGSGLLKRLAINIGYEFLRRNTRGPRNMLTSPHASTLEVGMIYNV